MFIGRGDTIENGVTRTRDEVGADDWLGVPRDSWDVSVRSETTSHCYRWCRQVNLMRRQIPISMCEERRTCSDDERGVDEVDDLARVERTS